MNALERFGCAVALSVLLRVYTVAPISAPQFLATDSQ